MKLKRSARMCKAYSLIIQKTNKRFCNLLTKYYCNDNIDTYFTNYNKNIIDKNNIFAIIKGDNMYQIIFYEDKKGQSEVADYIQGLRIKSATSKTERVNFNKVVAYFDMLEEYGTRIGEPVTKHLNGEIWELRPLKNRFLYAYVENDTFVILHHFVKKTQKTPKREIEKAKRYLQDYLERYGD